jgi:hypothetical protein
MTDQSTTPRKLPVLSIVTQAYRAPLANLGPLARVSWLWLVLMLTGMFLFYWTVWPWHPGPADGDYWVETAIWWAELIVPLPFLSSIAVAWHRFLLRDEQVRSSLYLRLDRVVWSYALICLLYWASVLVWVSYGVLWPEIHDAETIPLTVRAAAVLLAGVFLVVGARVSIVLPAIALETPGAGWRQVWIATRFNTWRLALGALLCVAPVLAIGPLLTWVDLSDHRTGHALQQAGYMLLEAILVIFGVSFLSFAYRWFFGVGDTLSGPKS